MTRGELEELRAQFYERVGHVVRHSSVDGPPYLEGIFNLVADALVSACAERGDVFEERENWIETARLAQVNSEYHQAALLKVRMALGLGRDSEDDLVEVCRAKDVEIAVLKAKFDAVHSLINIIFDGPPSHEAGRFVEVETDDGRSVNVGEWKERPDGLWALRSVR